MAGVTGLDYVAVFKIFEIYNVKNQAETLEGIQVMEAAILSKISKQQPKS